MSTALEILLLTAVAAALMAAGWYLYGRVRARVGRRITLPLASLRAFAFLILALLLVKPNFTCRQASIKPTLVVLVDRSGSMSIRDAPGGLSRYESARRFLSSIRGSLSSGFVLKEQAFDAGVAPLAEKDSPNGKASNILNALAQSHRGAAAVLLLSDGCDTSALRTAARVPENCPPVFAVGFGSRDGGAIRDIGVALAPPPPNVYKDSTFTVRVRIRNRNMSGAEPTVALEEDGKTVGSVRVRLGKPLTETTLSHRPQVVGLHRYTVKVEPQPDELTSDNNEAAFWVNVSENRISVFYAEGVPRWEYKFLSQTLRQDPNVEFTGSVRTAGETFTLQGVRKTMRLVGGLPASEKDFEGFDVIILGDLPRSLMPEAQMEIIEKMVLDGGSLIVVAGSQILDPSYARSKLAAMLPVRTGGAVQKFSASFVPQPTDAGRNHPILEGYAGQMDASAEQPPHLETLYVVGPPKPGAVVLMEHPSLRVGDRPAPVVAIQRYGEGHVILIASDTFWNWFFRFRALGRQSPYVRFFGQLLRWASRAEDEGGGPLVVRARPRIAEPGEVIDVEVVPQGEVEIDSVSMSVERGGKALRKPDLSRAENRLTAALTIFEPGRYDLKAQGAGRDGKAVTAVTTVVVGDELAEFRTVLIDEELLSLLAEKTRGRYLLPPQTDALLAELNGVAAGLASGAHNPLWQHPLLFLLLVGAVCAEYFLRKRRGLV